jgi:dihydrofolate synthase/folylpolyglutamate synthase
VTPPPDSEAAVRLAAVEAALSERWPETRLEPSLDRIRLLVDLLGDPQESAPVIQITGTNGKTSTARMVDSLLRAFDLRVGRFTSPHLESVTERIVVDGRPLSAERFVEVYEDVAAYVELVDGKSAALGGPPMSYFEALTGMAFAAFADAPVDVAVLEVGLGGAWDATTIADAAVAVIAPIGMDHADYLGDTLAQIAAEKAGIIKEGSLVIVGQQPVEAAEAILRRAVEVGAVVAREGLEFGVASREVAVGGQRLALQGLGGVYDEVFLPLHGPHQAHNAALALAAVEAFFGAGAGPGGEPRMLDVDVVRAAFASVASPGRLEVVRRGPTILVDAAHNPAGALALAAAVTDAFGFERLVGVVGVLEGKDARGILAALEPVLDHVVATRSGSPRALPPGRLAAIAGEVFGPERVTVAESLPDAVERAVELADVGGEPGGVGVLVAGSVTLAGDARALLRRAGGPAEGEA